MYVSPENLYELLIHPVVFFKTETPNMVYMTCCQFLIFL